MNEIICEKIFQVEINVEKINHNFVLFFYEEHLSGTISTHMCISKKIMQLLKYLTFALLDCDFNAITVHE